MKINSIFEHSEAIVTQVGNYEGIGAYMAIERFGDKIRYWNGAQCVFGPKKYGTVYFYSDDLPFNQLAQKYERVGDAIYIVNIGTEV